MQRKGREPAPWDYRATQQISCRVQSAPERTIIWFCHLMSQAPVRRALASQP